MWCPNCKSEYRPGFTRCTECGAELVEALPEGPELDPVFLTETMGDRAWELPELLNRAGIACYLYGGDGIFIRLLPSQAVPGKLYVDRRDEAAARRALSLLAEPVGPVAEDVLLEAYEEYMHDSEPEDAPSGGAAWKVFVALAVIAVACLMAGLLLR